MAAAVQGSLQLDVGRVEAAHEPHRHQPRPTLLSSELLLRLVHLDRFGKGRRQWLLTHHRLASSQTGQHQLGVS